MGYYATEIGALSDRGLVRNHNEDALGYIEPTDEAVLERKGSLYIVADGMGGHLAGEIASAYAVHKIIETYYDHPSPDTAKALKAAVWAGHERILDEAAQRDTYGMGTTAVATVIRGKQLTVANVGDSPAYLIREGKRTELSESHSWVAMAMQQGILTPEQAATHPNRNVITRFLGMEQDLEIYVSEPIALHSKDTILLCSDGLSNVVSEDEMIDISTDAAHSAQKAAEYLFQLVRSRGAPDNMTVLILRLRTLSADAQSP